MFQIIKKRWYIFLLFILIGGFIYLQISSNASAKAKKENKYIVKRLNLQDALSLSGSIDADEHAVLKFQTSGMLSWVGVREGDYVKKFQGLGSLDTRELQKNLKKYLNTYMKSRWDFEQNKDDTKISKIGGYTDEARTSALRVFDKAQFSLDNTVLDVELQDIALKYAYLYSPIEGIVTKVDVPFPGVNITPAGAEFEVINPKTIYFSATADQVDIVKLKEKLEGSIVFDAFPDTEIKGIIGQISFIPKSGETGTVYKVKINIPIDNSDYRYRFGMTGDANFILKNIENVIAIPSNYVKTENNKKYVMKIVAGKKVKTYIQTGDEIDNNIIVTSGLKENETITD